MEAIKYPVILLAILLIGMTNCKKEEQDPFETDDSGMFTDARDGNEYKWVRIGDQIWMAENMKYFPSITPLHYFSKTDLCYYVLNYMGSDINEAKQTSEYLDYGVLYNFISAQNCCPEGWRLATDLDWEKLAEFISIDNGGYNKDDGNWEMVGGHLKSTYGWPGEGNGTDDYGFCALCAGEILDSSEFLYLKTACYFWTYTAAGGDQAYFRFMGLGNSMLIHNTKLKSYGFSARCIKN